MKNLNKPKARTDNLITGPLPSVTTEEALLSLLKGECEKRERLRKNTASYIMIDETQFLRLVDRVERTEEEDERFFEASLERADYGAMVEHMKIEQWLLMSYGRADDLIAAHTIVGYLSELGLPNSLLMERREGRSYVESTQTFERCFGVRVKVRLLQ